MTNEVRLSLEEYNELRDIKENFLKDKILMSPIQYHCYVGITVFSGYQFCTKDEAINALVKKIEGLEKQNEQLEKQKNSYYNYKKIVTELKEMSGREFKKWKKSKINL